MALRLPPLQTIIHLLQPAIARQPLITLPVLRRIPIPSIPALSLSIPTTTFAGVSDLLREIWEGILRAVPKKKTSHMKKRHRQMAGKGLKDVTALNKCSACGKVKRAHVLCPYCVQAVRHWMKPAVVEFPSTKQNSNDGPNLAEHSPVWQHLKKAREEKAIEKKKRADQDKTKW